MKNHELLILLLGGGLLYMMKRQQAPAPPVGAGGGPAQSDSVPGVTKTTTASNSGTDATQGADSFLNDLNTAVDVGTSIFNTGMQIYDGLSNIFGSLGGTPVIGDTGVAASAPAGFGDYSGTVYN